MIARDSFLEWAHVHGQRYGTSRQAIEERMAQGADVILEIDLTHGSLHKFPLYTALGVPEIWRYDGRHAHFYHLRGTEYVGRPHSLAFPLLSAAILTQFLEESKTVGQTAALRAFRQWLREMLRQS